jgi:NAD(P)-dependent dehydrogenase (short-subunit alcohol dehydrogenase family)
MSAFAPLLRAAEMKEVYDTNVFAVVRMVHAPLPLLQASKQPRIVNIEAQPHL